MNYIGQGPSNEPLQRSNMHTLLSKDNLTPSAQNNQDWSIVPGKTQNMATSNKGPVGEQDTASYLQSNLAALMPEQGAVSYESQSGLSSGSLGKYYIIMFDL